MARSPNYPRFSLPEAIESIRTVWKKEGRNKLNPEALSQVLGFASYHGAAQAVVSVLRKYGLVEGRGKDLRVSQTAINILEAPEGSSQRTEAILEAALSPALFAELHSEYETLPSESTLRIDLLNREFTRDAADTAAAAYRATMDFVARETKRYNDAPDDAEAPARTSRVEPAAPPKAGVKLPVGAPRMPEVTQGSVQYEQAVFPLEEGDVALQWPRSLSQASYDDIEDWLKLALRRMKRSVPDSGVGAGEGKAETVVEEQ